MYWVLADIADSSDRRLVTYQRKTRHMKCRLWDNSQHFPSCFGLVSHTSLQLLYSSDFVGHTLESQYVTNTLGFIACTVALMKWLDTFSLWLAFWAHWQLSVGFSSPSLCDHFIVILNHGTSQEDLIAHPIILLIPLNQLYT